MISEQDQRRQPVQLKPLLRASTRHRCDGKPEHEEGGEEIQQKGQDDAPGGRPGLRFRLFHRDTH